MDIIVINILLTLIRCIDVGFRVFNEVVPSDATDIRCLSMPVGKPVFASVSFCGFIIKHILSNDSESIVLKDRGATTSAAITVPMKIVIGTICIGKNHGQHSIGVAGICAAALGLAFTGS